MIDYGQDHSGHIGRLPQEKGVEADAAEAAAAGFLMGRFRWVDGIGWHHYDQGVWRHHVASRTELLDTVRQVIRHQIDEFRAEGNREQAALWQSLLTRQRIESVADIAKGLNGILTRHESLDHGPLLVNTRNGVFNLATGLLERHNPRYLLTKQTGAEYDRSAQSNVWAMLLDAVPLDVQPWLQLRLGQALTGEYDQSLTLTVGGGMNGKSMFMSAVMRAFGDYATTVPHRILHVGNGQHPTELMELRGRRLVLMEETPEEGQLDPHQLKTIIGTPEISARRMRQDPIIFRASHSLFINTNHYPQVPSTDHGTWRRLLAVKFPFRFVNPGTVDRLGASERWGSPDIAARIQADADLPAACLAWIIEGARRYLTDRDSLHQLPPAVQDATGEWRRDSDVCYQFATEHLKAAPNHLIPGSYLVEKFNAFLEAQGKRKWSNRLIHARLSDSLTAAMNMPTAYTVVKVGVQHELGIKDPFDARRNALTAGKAARAYVDLSYE
jgi:putative DNA primase/helicase